MIKGIVFDKDGTLLEYKAFWIPVTESAVDFIALKYEIDAGLKSVMLDELGVYGDDLGLFFSGTYGDYTEVFNKVLRENGHDRLLPSQAVSEAFSRCLPAGKLIPTCENIRDVFLKLKDKGIKTAVVTTDNQTITERCLKTLGIYELVDSVYADDGVSPTKPNPYYMNCFCEKFGFDKAEVLMVGDTMTDMEFARNSEVLAVAVAKNDKYKSILEEKSDFVIYDISHIFEVIQNVENNEI